MTIAQPSERSNDDQQIGCTAKILVQATWPHSAAAGKEITLRNGDTTVHMYSPYGLPYGVNPRLIMCWLTQEAVVRNALWPIDAARTIPLGHSLRDFMRQLGLPVTGGRKGTIRSLEEQLKRMLGTTVIVETNTTDNEKIGIHHNATVLIDQATLWWDAQHPDQGTLESSELRLSRNFFEELVTKPVPLDMGILGALRKSPLAIDLYAWLTYRLSYLRQPTLVKWDQLKHQLGTSYPDDAQGRRNFKRKTIAALEKVTEAWPTVAASAVTDGILLRRGRPSVPKLKD